MRVEKKKTTNIEDDMRMSNGNATLSALARCGFGCASLEESNIEGAKIFVPPKRRSLCVFLFDDTRV